MRPCQNPSAPSPQLNALSSSVSFNGWRYANTKFKLWAREMAAKHESIWREAGIYEAVIASTYKIIKNTDLVLGIAEKWCPDTNTFVFPWGEATVTLEDVMLLSGFSVSGSPVFAPLDSSGEMMVAKLKTESRMIKRKANVGFVTQVGWMERFMNTEDELEHVAFLVLWLSYFVLPSHFYHLSEASFPIAVHLSTGSKIALAPTVLAHLYGELSLLKTHIRDFNKSPIKIEINLSAMFKLVQVWTWERFRELQPKPNPLLQGEPRLALWNELKQKTSDARQILDNSKMDSFEWRPYTKTVTNWEFPKFYPEKAMCVHVCPSIDDEFVSFARCINVCELVGIEKVEHYFPNRVASQFGMLQDVPSTHVNRNNLSLDQAAWNDYNKPINDMELYIPSRSATPRVTARFCEWWRKTSPGFQYYSKEKGVVESAETSNARNMIGNYTGIVPSCSKMNSTNEDEMNIAEDSNKRRKCMEQARDKRRKCMNQAREIGSNRTSKDEMKIAEDSNKSTTMGLCQTQENDKGDDSLTVAQWQSLNKKEYYNGEDASEPLGKKSILEADNNDYVHSQRNEEADHESGSKAGKNMAVIPFDDGNKESKSVLQEDGMIAGRKACSDEKETKKSSEDLENRNDGFGEGNADSYEMRFQELKVLASSLEERINKALKTVAFLKERRAEKLRKIAAPRLI